MRIWRASSSLHRIALLGTRTTIPLRRTQRKSWNMPSPSRGCAALRSWGRPWIGRWMTNPFIRCGRLRKNIKFRFCSISALWERQAASWIISIFRLNHSKCGQSVPRCHFYRSSLRMQQSGRHLVPVLGVSQRIHRHLRQQPVDPVDALSADDKGSV